MTHNIIIIGAVLAATISSAVSGAAVEPSSGAYEVVPDDGFFPFETLQLTNHVLDDLKTEGFPDVSLFSFSNDKLPHEKAEQAQGYQKTCKTYPDDDDWPDKKTWRGFASLLGAALIKTVPEPAVCYDDPEWQVFDLEKCENLTTNWRDSLARHTDPTSIRSILYQGLTCMPPDLNGDFLGRDPGCELGGHPEYVVNVASVAQIQLAVNFARNANIRLVIKNTGHDFGGKSTGMGSISIWTHNLKDSKFYEKYETVGYSGPAVKFGAGIQVFEANAFAQERDITLIGGEGMTVGLVGGYAQGGGHSPLSSIWGMASDQILSVSLVTADGSFIQADAKTNKDIFWAVCGGGGSTYGVVTSMVFKAYPKIKITTMTWSMTTGDNLTADQFWAAQKAYVDRFEEYADAGYYNYYRIRHVNGSTTNDPVSFIAPKTTVKELRTAVAPMLQEWEDLGVSVSPTFREYDDYTSAWAASFPLEGWSIGMRQTSRLMPRSTLADDKVRADLVRTLRDMHEEGAHFVLFNMRNPPGYDEIDNSVNPAFRDMLMFVIPFILWNTTDTPESIEEMSRRLTFEWNPKLRALAPNSGTYMSESDYIEPDRPQSFHGDKYPKLYDLKQRWDPHGVFYAQNAVGSEDWFMTEELLNHLPSQNSKLCRV